MGYFGYDIALSGLSAAQKAIAVTQNNIANMNTEGYARESLDFKEAGYTSDMGLNMQIGSGVYAGDVTRIKDDYLIQQSRDQQSQTNYYQGLQTNLSSVEQLFNETQDSSMTNALNNFFNAWTNASQYPEDMSYRQALVGAANDLSNRFVSTESKISDLKSQTDNNIQSQVTTANDLIQKIADINKQIAKLGTDDANQLFDQRDQYLDKLSQYVNIDTVQTNKNMIDVRTNGVLLVSSDVAHQITAQQDNQSQAWSLSANGVVLNPSSGSIKSLIDTRNTYYPNYESQLNTLASTIISKVNSLHSTGYGLDNSTGNNFFLGTNATTIAVNPTLVSNPQSIALSSASNTPGNSDIASQIASIGDMPLLNGGTTSPLSYYKTFITQVGNDVYTNGNDATVHQNVLQGVNDAKQSVQGVNMDEEMNNLMQFQRYYSANGKTIQTLNQMFDDLTKLF